MSSVAILSPGYPDSPGGVTDHTARLSRNWSLSGVEARVLGDVSLPVSTLAKEIEARSTAALLIQYVPFLYGRRGLSKLPVSLASSCQALGIRVTTFVHEPWVPPTRLPWLVLSPLHKRQLRRLTSVSDAVVTAVPAWAKKFGTRTKTVYVGSTLGEPPEEIEFYPPLDSPVVFSPFAAGLRWDWIVGAVEAIGAGLTIIGSDRAITATHPAVSRYANEDWDYKGRMSAEAALRLLARTKLVLAPFVDGITGRRTSAMAALSVGARVLTSTGPLYDRFFAEGVAGVARSSAEFVEAATRVWNTAEASESRASRLQWYRTHLAGAKLDEDLLAIVSP